jgi:hypothetical protein
MAELAFADEMERACRYCATFARANSQLIYERRLVPRPEDETGTVAFVRFDGRTYAVTALHVIQAFRSQAERDGRAPESYFLPAGKGVLILPLFVAAPENFPLPAPDTALCEIDAGLPAYIGKEAFELRPEAKPVYPVAYAAAVGFPTAVKSNRAEPLGVLKPAGRFFLLQNSPRPRVTKLPHRPKIHENTLILTRRALKQLFEFNTVV